MPAPILNVVAALLLLSGCTTDASRRAAANAAIQGQAAQQISRICALPQSEREAEIEKIKAEADIVVHCGEE
jgi:outer membrane biogenesis lipoprotein LolB